MKVLSTLAMLILYMAILSVPGLLIGLAREWGQSMQPKDLRVDSIGKLMRYWIIPFVAVGALIWMCLRKVI